MDITQLILDDHHEQRRLFAIIEQINSSDVRALSAVWGRLAVFLELHAAAEEELFYPALLRVGIAALSLQAIKIRQQRHSAHVVRIGRHQLGGGVDG